MLVVRSDMIVMQVVKSKGKRGLLNDEISKESCMEAYMEKVKKEN